MVVTPQALTCRYTAIMNYTLQCVLPILLLCVTGCTNITRHTFATNQPTTEPHSRNIAARQTAKRYIVLRVEKETVYPLTLTSVSNARRESTHWFEVFFVRERIAFILSGQESLENLARASTPILDITSERYCQPQKSQRQIHGNALPETFVDETTTYGQSEVFALTPNASDILERKVADHVRRRSTMENK